MYACLPGVFLIRKQMELLCRDQVQESHTFQPVQLNELEHVTQCDMI